jgi:hypothetical protein
MGLLHRKTLRRPHGNFRTAFPATPPNVVKATPSSTYAASSRSLPQTSPRHLTLSLPHHTTQSHVPPPLTSHSIILRPPIEPLPSLATSTPILTKNGAIPVLPLLLMLLHDWIATGLEHLTHTISRSPLLHWRSFGVCKNSICGA